MRIEHGIQTHTHTWNLTWFVAIRGPAALLRRISLIQQFVYARQLHIRSFFFLLANNTAAIISKHNASKQRGRWKKSDALTFGE